MRKKIVTIVVMLIFFCLGTRYVMAECDNVGDKCCLNSTINGSFIAWCNNDLECDVTIKPPLCKINEKYRGTDCGKPGNYCCLYNGKYFCESAYNTSTSKNICAQSTVLENNIYAVNKCELVEENKINTCQCSRYGGILQNNCKIEDLKVLHCIDEDINGAYNGCGCFTESEWQDYQKNTSFVDGRLHGKCLSGYACLDNLVCNVDANKCEVYDFYGSCNCIDGKVDPNNNACTDPNLATCSSYRQSTDNSVVHMCLCMDPRAARKTIVPIGGASGGGVGDAELPDYPDGVGFKFKDATLGTVIGKIIEYIYIFAGFALLVALLMGGFTVLTAAGSPEKAQKGYNQATYGVIGFIIIFVSYMVVLLIQAIFHVKIFF